MANDNSGETGSPSRRSLLKMAATGAFAVPLIASFSMDSASAQTTKPIRSSNQVITSNMFCSNMTSYPTSVFFADLQHLDEDSNPTGMAAGIANLQLIEGLDEFYYELLVAGSIADFRIYLNDGSTVIEVSGAPLTGTINGSSLNCGPESMATLYTNLAYGGASIDVDLRNGQTLQGTFFPQIHNIEPTNRFSSDG